MLRLSCIIIAFCTTVFVLSSSVHKHAHIYCGENEVLNACINRVCEYKRCSDVGQPIECIKVDHKYCIKGCLCRHKYLRADNGTCIPANQCPNARKCPKPNEYYDPCPPKCPSRTCAVTDIVTCPEPLQVGDPRCPPPSCRCNVGFYRDSDGSCVTWNLCKTCPQNERPVPCIQARCERRECCDLPQPVACVRIDPKFCTEGCLCEDGYLRSIDGKCIPIDECPEAQCGNNEVFDLCPPKCPGDECGVDPRLVLCPPNPQPGDPSCQPRCRCCDGYARNEEDQCIPRDECPSICGCNEVYDTCIAQCPPRTCDSIGKSIKCPPPLKPGDKRCEAGCRCADNYYRNDDNVCVPKCECQRCPKNETQVPCIEAKCERRECCDLLQPVTCVSINPKLCTEGCLCEDGYLRSKDGKCIPIGQCPEAQCGNNEVFDLCPPKCPGEECGVDPRLVLCPPNPQPGDPNCQPRCRCCDGYSKNEEGQCIPSDECPPTCGSNEVYDTCIAQCPPRTCDSIGTTVKCPPPLKPGDKRCEAGCRCADNYYRNDDNVCVPKSECQTCPQNERPVPCIQARCERRKCCDLLEPVVCVDVKPMICTKGCLCEDGYLRSEDGKCIPVDQCPEAQCENNEVFDLCPPTCPGEDCGVDPTLVLCPPNPQPGDPSCQPRCRCCGGYSRDEEGQCIPSDECPPVCEANEVYDTCIAQCPPRTCDSIGKSIKCPPPLKPGDKRCEAGCRCADNYYRNDDNVCVPKSECPPVCEANEVYDTCIAQCPPRTCDSIGKSIKCPPPMKPGDKRCEAGCRCADNYYRNDDNVCVPKSECPPVCEANEVYDTCIAQCPPRTCDSIGKSIKCPPPMKPGDKRCEAGCRCADNYYRNDDNECVPKSECPPVCEANEVYDTCIAQCPPRTCDSIGKSIKCPPPMKPGDKRCEAGCRCADNYYRNDDNECVPESECPPVCEANEVYDTCIAQCPPRTCDSIGKSIKCPPPLKPGDKRCEAGCRCDDNYYRNSDNVCVSKSECREEAPAPAPPGKRPKVY